MDILITNLFLYRVFYIIVYRIVFSHNLLRLNHKNNLNCDACTKLDVTRSKFSMALRDSMSPTTEGDFVKTHVFFCTVTYTLIAEIGRRVRCVDLYSGLGARGVNECCEKHTMINSRSGFFVKCFKATGPYKRLKQRATHNCRIKRSPGAIQTFRIELKKGTIGLNIGTTKQTLPSLTKQCNSMT